MEVTERFSKRSIQYLNSLTSGDVYNYLNNDMTIDDKKAQYKKIKDFCKIHIKSKYEIKRLYKHSFKYGDIHEGRLFGCGAVQNIPRDFRAVVCRDISTDIDQNASHPTILRFLCKKNNILCPNLDYYINNRNDIYDSFDAPRNETKKLFLIAVNSDKLKPRIKNKFFKDFDKEMKYIHKELLVLDEYKHYFEASKQNKTFNWNGSAINCILCKYENNILQEMISIINKHNIEILSLMFDGIMVYGDYYKNTELLNEMETHINKVFDGLNMKLSYKSHSDVIQIPKKFDEDDDNKDIEDLKKDPLFYDNFKLKFEETHSKIINSSSFIKLYDDSDFIFMKKQNMLDSFQHLKCKILKQDKKTDDFEIVKVPFIQQWLNDENIKTYDDVDIYPPPLKCPKNVLNLWTGFAFEKIENYTENKYALQLILNHIKILCNNENNVYEYIVNWIGQMIQYPAIKTICPIFISDEGAGKGRFLELLTRMMGKEKVFETTRPSDHIWGKFNPVMRTAFFCGINELGKKEIIGFEDHFKAIITDESMMINDKGQKAHKIKSYHRLCGFSNNEEPIPLPKDTRRFVVIRSSDEKINDFEYFNELSRLLEDDDVIKTCFEYFKSIPDLDKFKKLKLPTTEYAEELKELKTSPVEMWFQDYIVSKATENEFQVSGKDLFELFKSYLVKYMPNYLTSYNPKSFGIRFNRLKIDGVEKHRKNFGVVFIFNIDKIFKYYKIDKIECMIDVMDNDNDSCDDCY